ncbi:MAG: hypothetical protein P8124_07530 [Gammaproteobacteria bacterium]
MNYGALSLEQAPALDVPVRFFLTAPAFGVLAAGGLLAGGPAVLGSRWTPQLLGVTHLLTLGFLTMTMFGALLQLLPVLAGVTIVRTRLISAVLYGVLVPGVLALALGLWSRWNACLELAVVMLAAACLLFAVVVLRALLGAAARRQPSVVAMTGAVVGFSATAGLGLVLAAGHAGARFGILRNLTDLHARLGLVAWVGVLVIGVAYQVVPMFQFTPAYPRRLSTTLVPLLLVAVSASAVGLLSAPANLVTATALAVFAAFTLVLQSRRRRRRPDVTLAYWRLAMICLLVADGLWVAAALLPDRWPAQVAPLAVGMLYIVGFGTSVISGMLYKIVPFLVWLHLQRRVPRRHQAKRTLPTMAEIIPATRMGLQYRVHCAGVLALVGAAFHPQWATYAAGGLLMAAWAGLWLNLWNAVRCYRHVIADSAALPDGA